MFTYRYSYGSNKMAYRYDRGPQRAKLSIDVSYNVKLSNRDFCEDPPAQSELFLGERGAMRGVACIAWYAARHGWMMGEGFAGAM
jgi:hypothetical protein